MDFILADEGFDKFIKRIKSLGFINDPFELTKIDSLILKNKEDLDKFTNLLSTQIKINKMKLLYRSSRDGLKLSDLRDKINNKSNLIFLLLTGNTRIFGCHIKSKIEVKNETYVKDKDAFVFCLNKNKIYKILIPENAIYFVEDYPILIGNSWNGNGFFIYSEEVNEYLLTNPRI